MATFNTVDELIRILDADPQLLEALRSRLLTKELLELPQRLDALAESVAELVQHARETDMRLDTLTQRLDALAESVAELVQHTRETDMRLDTLTLRLDALAESVAELVQHARETDMRLDTLTQRMDTLTQRLDALTQKFTEYTEITDRRLDDIDKRLDTLTQSIAEMAKETNRRLDATDKSIEGLKGSVLETALEKDGLARIVGMFNLRNIRTVRVAEQNRSSAEFNAAIYDAEIRGILTASEYLRLLNTDMIVRGFTSGTTNLVYVTSEASYTTEHDDIIKVSSSAAVLRKVFPDAEVHPVLYYVNMSDSLARIAETEGVSVLKNLRL